MAGRRGEPRVAAAEAEADREDGRAAEPAQVRDRRGDVRLDELRLRLGDVRHVLEVVAALGDAGRAAEVVDRDRREAALGEAKRELLVEAVEPADVGQDDDAGLGRPVRPRAERGELGPVGRRQHEVVVRDRRPGKNRDRRQRIGVEAHFGRNLLAGGRRRDAVDVPAMTEQSHREEMSAAIRAQRERKAAPRSIAPEPEPAAQPAASRAERRGRAGAEAPVRAASHQVAFRR